MKEIKADFVDELLSNRWDAVCITTNTTLKNNGCLVMGAGIAKLAKEEFPILDKEWGKRIRLGWHKNGFMITHISDISMIDKHQFFIAFPTKDDWKENSTLQRIIRSLDILTSTVDILGFDTILLPRPGCSNGGLEWNKVKPILENRLDDRYTVISRG